MNNRDFETLVAGTVTKMKALIEVKGAEYAGHNVDRLANFKRGAGLTGCTPLQVSLIYLSKHYDAVSNYIKDRAAGREIVSSEPIEGRLDDIIVYCLLIKGLIAEDRGDFCEAPMRVGATIADTTTITR